MSRRANPMWVGAFVLGAAALAVAAIAVFGSGRLFRETHAFVLYFQGSVNGLNIGAPVKFKGVEVGSVKRIMVRFEQTAGEVSIPVFIELDAEKLARAGVHVEFSPDAIHTAVDQGLRGRLEAQSLVTGLLFVNLDYFPETPARFVGVSGGLPEIPTLPTTIEEATQVVKQIVERLGQLDLEAMVKSATETLDALARSRGLEAGEERGGEPRRDPRRPARAVAEPRPDHRPARREPAHDRRGDAAPRAAALQDPRRRAADRRAGLAPHAAARDGAPGRLRRGALGARARRLARAEPRRHRAGPRRRRGKTVTAAPPRLLLAGLSALLSVGCSLLAPAPDPSRFYVLSALGAGAAAESDLALGVGPVRLPGYLAVSEIQVRASATELRRSSVDRWAEPLEEGIARVLAQNLSAELGTRDVVLFPWYAGESPRYQVQLSVRRFELDPDGSGVLEARYEVSELAGKRSPVIRDVELRQAPASGGVAASVAALSETLAELARRVAADVRALGG